MSCDSYFKSSFQRPRSSRTILIFVKIPHRLWCSVCLTYYFCIFSILRRSYVHTYHTYVLYYVILKHVIMRWKKKQPLIKRAYFKVVFLAQESSSCKLAAVIWKLLIRSFKWQDFFFLTACLGDRITFQSHTISFALFKVWALYRQGSYSHIQGLQVLGYKALSPY